LFCFGRGCHNAPNPGISILIAKLHPDQSGNLLIQVLIQPGETPLSDQSIEIDPCEDWSGVLTPNCSFFRNVQPQVARTTRCRLGQRPQESHRKLSHITGRLLVNCAHRDNELSRLPIQYFNLKGMDFSGKYSLSAGGYSIIEIPRDQN
jgi:hypothetical protein